MAVKKPISKMKRKSLGNGKAAVKTAAKKIPAIKDPLSKSGVIKTIADVTGVHKKEVTSIFDCLLQLIEKHIKGNGPGTFVMPGVAKFKVIKKPARPARK